METFLLYTVYATHKVGGATLYSQSSQAYRLAASLVSTQPQPRVGPQLYSRPQPIYKAYGVLSCRTDTMQGSTL